MKNNREIEGPKYKKEIKKKNQGKDMWHVGKWEEVSSFFKIRLRVIHKKREDILELEREALPSL